MNSNQDNNEPLLPRIGNYRKLLTYQKAEAIFDITWYFCNKYLHRRDRTIDQMIQAARSGKQNFVEGCSASVTSKGLWEKMNRMRIERRKDITN